LLDVLAPVALEDRLADDEGDPPAVRRDAHVRNRPVAQRLRRGPLRRYVGGERRHGTEQRQCRGRRKQKPSRPEVHRPAPRARKFYGREPAPAIRGLRSVEGKASRPSKGGIMEPCQAPSYSSKSVPASPCGCGQRTEAVPVTVPQTNPAAYGV